MVLSKLEVCSLCSRQLPLNPGGLCLSSLVRCCLEVAAIQGCSAGEFGQMDQVHTGEQTLSHSSGTMWDHKDYEPLSSVLFLP